MWKSLTLNLFKIEDFNYPVKFPSWNLLTPLLPPQRGGVQGSEISKRNFMGLKNLTPQRGVWKTSRGELTPQRGVISSPPFGFRVWKPRTPIGGRVTKGVGDFSKQPKKISWKNSSDVVILLKAAVNGLWKIFRESKKFLYLTLINTVESRYCKPWTPFYPPLWGGFRFRFK